MAVRVASAEWKGNLPKGSGTLETETGAVKGNYSFASRFEEGAGTNPEELIAAAHAGCFSMAFANGLAKAGFDPVSVRTTAKAYLEKGPDGFGISQNRIGLRRERARHRRSGLPGAGSGCEGRLSDLESSFGHAHRTDGYAGEGSRNLTGGAHGQGPIC